MTKVRTFSRVFPSYHPRAGEPTYFVEKIWESLGSYWSDGTIPLLNECAMNFTRFGKSGIDHDKGITWPKHHTIRAGHHFKPGDWFSPRVWSGVPYKSKQIIIAPDIQVKKTWSFAKDLIGGEFRLNGIEIYPAQIQEIANNDGLTIGEFMSWFNEPFDGQIICWNENINY